ncbi:rhodanese-like domain-containing protein [Macrococcus bovicus]|uniref:rhodanese-like domain-containing protein n=1 Tax=Macrococcus bovicus TaxID=69968 RepID=UPI0025A4D529|nr:rhodanese-like domain-containing protein [Macrococcus bovicus]WJP97838.1 rhodanese-like domain-containing protein [Macrococcus bovicus]
MFLKSLFRRIPSVSTTELETLMKERINLLDVRTPAEFQAGHIRGAKNVPLTEIQHYQNKDQVYVICQSGMRSKRAAQILSDKGIDVVNVRGGMSAWAGRRVTGKK